MAGSDHEGEGSPSEEQVAEDPRLKLVFDDATRSNTQQQAVLDNLRGRTATLVSAAAISTAFLGAQALEGRVGFAGVAAIGAFVLSQGLAISVLWPRTDWDFRFNARDLLRDYVDETPVDVNNMRAILAEHLEDNYQANKARLDKYFFRFKWAAALLIIEVVFWLLELAWGHL